MAKRSDVVKALDQHEQELSRRRNVVGLGVVPADDSQKELAVGVYVVQKVPLEELPEGEVIPKTLPVKVRGKTLRVPTRVIEQGKVTVERELPGKG